eukprot:TRINITY_DN1088_c0_g1_i10.p1 TRINITY_DN1088_c0_g1~~TRINITY_DN1088_c0_g1_i10.p1  ORF type:complete len:545 (-),score=224.40 TRINITY_DN1088_c0_g1_i10:201-1835(-)
MCIRDRHGENNKLKSSSSESITSARPMDLTTKCTWKPNSTEKSPHYHQAYGTRPKIYDNVLDAIGNTPMIRLNRIPQSEGVKAQFVAKCEFLNPGGSIKDRIGYRMVADAEKSGRIAPGATLIEATSGNTGIGLAMAAAVKGYKMIITLPEKMSNEKVDVLKAFGAEVVRTPTEAAWDAPDSHIGIALSMNKEIPNSHILDQYSNPANPLVHYDLTAEEIIDQTNGDLDYLFISVGTGGAIAGIARKLKEKLPRCKVIGIDPIGSVLAVPESLNVPGGPYKVEGIGYDFIPKVLDRSPIDGWVKTEDKESFYYSRRLIREEGLLVGGSAGSTLAGALRYCKENGVNEKHKCCIVFSDSVRNYMTKFLSKDWMIENDFLPWDEYNDAKHILADKGVDALGLKPIKTFDDSVTVAQALEAFNSGQRTVPILKDGKVRCVVFQHKLLQAIVNKNLKQADLANKGMTKDFVLMPSTLNLAQVERSMERNVVALIGKTGANGNIETLYEVTPLDVLNVLKTKLQLIVSITHDLTYPSTYSKSFRECDLG